MTQKIKLKQLVILDHVIFPTNTIPSCVIAPVVIVVILLFLFIGKKSRGTAHSVTTRRISTGGICGRNSVEEEARPVLEEPQYILEEATEEEVQPR
jgi:hypothetical protein